MKKTIAVFFGGQSVEHDVSILSGLQFLEAIDDDLYDSFPVYVAPNGCWYIGDALRSRDFYPLDETNAGQLTQVYLGLGERDYRQSRPMLDFDQKGLFGTKHLSKPFDCAVTALHGTNGEDGSFQGMMQFAGIPVAGCQTLSSAATMDKAFTKQILKSFDVPVLGHHLVRRPPKGHHIDDKLALDGMLADLGDNPWPIFVKPRSLGSSVGVSKAENAEDYIAALLKVFRLDEWAIVEPFVPNLVEYNVAVRREDGDVFTSVIERPQRASEFLDFSAKYRSGDGKGSKGGAKSAPASEGMASLNRVLNPEELTDRQIDIITTSAKKAADALMLSGSVRIDFLCDEKTGDLWLNEINTIPGSFAWYLWVDAQPPMPFTELTTKIIQEGFDLASQRLNDTSAKTGAATIFKR